MIPGFDVEAMNMLGKLISRLERYHLEGAAPEEFDPRDLFDENEQSFFRVQGLSKFWEAESGVDFAQHMADLVIGAHNQQQADLTMVMLGTSSRLSVYVSLGDAQATSTLLQGLFPGIILEPVKVSEIMELIMPYFAIKGVLTGVPSNKSFVQESQSDKNEQNHRPASSAKGSVQAQLERVIRGMYGTDWAYIVQAHPRPRHKIIEERMKTIDLLTQVTNRSRFQTNTTKQESEQFTTVESGGTTQSYSADVINYRAQYLIRQLERELERLDQAAAAGQWTVHAYFGARRVDDARRLSALLLGTLAGADSRPEPLRAALCEPNGHPLESFHTFLTSQEVASMILLPREEVSGYALHDFVRFDIDFRAPANMTLPLGHIQQNGRDTPGTYNISADALAKHAVVIGVTGSGKTTTVMNLLDCAVEAGKPFLVIEPAKTEYRSLHSAVAHKAQLRVYTLGNEMVAPFRLNPFEFETANDPGDSSLLTHIDFLKAVFNAAFVLYSPMPQVLEEALHEVYEDKGWDLTSGTNRRIPNWQERHKYPIFPTLTDLYYKVEDVTNRLNYDKEIESNIKAGLKARIGSLRIGSKGLMLDTVRGVSMSELLATPTVLELEGIGSDDEKTFIMGLFLTRLYEYRRLQATIDAAAKGLSGHGLKHLMVFEEAHRLLQNTSTQVGSESANPRAQAIEAFTNMLSEMRAYGQGVLVAEQIPSKLAPDVLKNTNLKIVHRLIAQDDRQSIGQTMNLTEEQMIHLGTLTPGMAAVYAEGADHAYLVRMENYKRKISGLIDADLKKMSRRYASVKMYQAITDLEHYNIPLSPLGGPDPATYHAAGKILDAERSKWLWARFLLCLTSNPAMLLNMITRISEQIEADMPHLQPEQHDDVLRMVIVRGSAEMMQKRGAQFGWTYNQENNLRILLTRGMLALVRAYSILRDRIEDNDTSQIEQAFEREITESSDHFEQFVNQYGQLTQRRQGPLAGCAHCPAKCLYRSEVQVLLSARERTWIDQELSSQNYRNDDERFEAVANSAIDIAQNWLGEAEDADPTINARSIGYCALLHNLAQAELNEYEQTKLSEDLQKYVFVAD